MGKVLKILGVVFLVIIALVVGLLVWSHQKGESVQEDFFEAVLSGDSARVLEMFDPRLRETIDEPVLAIWMGAVREHLGDYQGMDASNFSTKASTGSDGSTVESKGTVKFAKGEAESMLRLLDGKIVAFKVTSDVFGDTWLTELPDRTLYHKRAQVFLTRLFEQDREEAYAMMHTSLQAKLPRESFGKAIDKMRAGLGKIQAYELVNEAFTAGPPQVLDLRYEIRGADDSLEASLGISFQGMQSHLTAIQIPAK